MNEQVEKKELLPGDLAFISKLVYESVGIVLEEKSRYLFNARLQRVAQRNNFLNIEVMINSLKKQLSSKIVNEIAEEFTTNETSFFRDPAVFDFVRGTLLPELLDKNRSSQHVRIWSAAASTGQEAYSLLLTIREECPIMLTWNFSILGTDISQQVLKIASNGVYKAHELDRGLSESLRNAYFTNNGKDWVVKDSLKKHVTFKQHNLKDPLRSQEQFDFVMLRNVLIYFDNDTKVLVLKNIKKVLKPNGYLFLGTTETIPKELTCFKQVNPVRVSCFQYQG